MNDYIFPFHTCETPKEEGIAQPYSAGFNIITCIIIFYFLVKTKSIPSFLLLFSILIFEAFHAFSHMIHLDGPLQTNIIHSLSYFMNISFFNQFYYYTNVFPASIFILYICGVIFLDIYAFYNYTVVYYLTTQSILFLSILFYYYPLLPTFIQKSIFLIFFLILVIIIFVLNETYNCENMMSIYPHFPYHSLIEITGIAFFYTLCSNFYKL